MENTIDLKKRMKKKWAWFLSVVFSVFIIAGTANVLFDISLVFIAVLAAGIVFGIIIFALIWFGLFSIAAVCVFLYKADKLMRKKEKICSAELIKNSYSMIFRLI